MFDVILTKYSISGIVLMIKGHLLSQNLNKNNSDFVNLNVMYVYRILWQASVCNSQEACYRPILALLETIIEIFFCLYRNGLNSRQFYNGKDRTLNGKNGFVTVNMLL